MADLEEEIRGLCTKPSFRCLRQLVMFSAMQVPVLDQVRKSQREKQFMQSCRISALDKQSTVKDRNPSYLT